MDDKSFQKLIDKAHKAAIKHRQLVELVGEECIERFGHHYSDLDIEILIDAVDYGRGSAKVQDVIKYFELAKENIEGRIICADSLWL